MDRLFRRVYPFAIAVDRGWVWEGEPFRIFLRGGRSGFLGAPFFSRSFVDFSVCFLVTFWMVFGVIFGAIFDEMSVHFSIKKVVGFSIDFSLILGWILGA